MSIDPAGAQMEWKYAAIAAGKTTATTIFSGAGIFGGIAITSIGVGAPLAYDNTSASGTIVQAVPASAALGWAQGLPPQGVVCPTGLTIAGGATNPAILAFYKQGPV